MNTLIFRDGRVIGLNTDREILAGIVATRACVIGAGGAALTLAPALPADVRTFSRRGEWPPDATGCDLIVNATPIRDELLIEPHAGQTVVDLAYRADGSDTAPPARRTAGDRRVRRARAPGREELRLWTGVAAPLSVMRDAKAV